MARTKPEQVPVGPVATEPGCAHPDCVLEHPHDGPAVLDSEAADRVRAAQAELDAAREAAAAGLPGGGYVIATAALHVAGGARAHLPGDRVPVGNVTRNGWEHLVRPAGPGE